MASICGKDTVVLEFMGGLREGENSSNRYLKADKDIGSCADERIAKESGRAAC